MHSKILSTAKFIYKKFEHPSDNWQKHIVNHFKKPFSSPLACHKVRISSTTSLVINKIDIYQQRVLFPGARSANRWPTNCSADTAERMIQYVNALHKFTNYAANVNSRSRSDTLAANATGIKAPAFTSSVNSKRGGAFIVTIYTFYCS